MVINKTIKDKAAMALQSLFVADAISMPVHWYYRVSDIYQAFPNGITQFEDAPDYHPSSIMSLHSTQKGGRKSANKKQRMNVIGDIILKGKRHHWGQANTHYHHGMKAGDNTLNAHCSKTLMSSIINNNHQYDTKIYLRDYVNMMTAEIPPHNDIYAESYHRGFFANYAQGKDIMNCAAKTHDTASIGGLVSIGPLAIFLAVNGHSINDIQTHCKRHLATTHPDQYLAQICDQYTILIYKLLFCDPQKTLNHVLTSFKQAVKFTVHYTDFAKIEDRYFVGGRYSSACYITDSWPSVLFFACKYHDDLAKGLLANANVGGDNVHRGAVLAIILGLMNNPNEHHHSQIMQWYQALLDHQHLNEGINHLLSID